MTIAGQRADTITPVSIADEVLVNRDGTTARQAIDSLAAQLANTGAIAALGDARRLFPAFADLPAASTQSVTFSAVVYDDPDGNKNGTWTVQLIAGVKTWDYAYPLREGAVISAIDEGEGTANAIEAVSKAPVSDGQFVKFKPFRDNGSGVVTVSFNGDTPLTIRDPGGSNVVAAAGLKAGVTISGFRNGNFFDLMTDILASASAASAAASAAQAAAIVGGLGSLTAAVGAAEDRAEAAAGSETNAAGSAGAAAVSATAAAASASAALNAPALSVARETWASLNAIAGSVVGQKGEVLDSDTGTHTDPVVGGTVANAGTYSWSASPAGWRWIGATGISTRTSKTSEALAEQQPNIFTPRELAFADISRCISALKPTIQRRNGHLVGSVSVAAGGAATPLEWEFPVSGLIGLDPADRRFSASVVFEFATAMTGGGQIRLLVRQYAGSTEITTPGVGQTIVVAGAEGIGAPRLIEMSNIAIDATATAIRFRVDIANPSGASPRTLSVRRMLLAAGNDPTFRLAATGTKAQALAGVSGPIVDAAVLQTALRSSVVMAQAVESQQPNKFTVEELDFQDTTRLETNGTVNVVTDAATGLQGYSVATASGATARYARWRFQRSEFGSEVSGSIRVLSVTPATVTASGSRAYVYWQFFDASNVEITAERVDFSICGPEGLSEETVFNIPPKTIPAVCVTMTFFVAVATVGGSDARTIVFRDMCFATGKQPWFRRPYISAARFATAHISPTGSDTSGTGSLSNPFATPAKAALSLEGVGDLILLPGLYADNLKIDRSFVRDLKLYGLTDSSKSRPRLRYGTRAGTITKTAGRTKVYEFATTDTLVPNWLYVDAVPDPTTVIASGRGWHGYRSAANRLPSARVFRATELSDLDAALTELDASTTWKFFLVAGSKYYFAPPSGATDGTLAAIYVPAAQSNFDQGIISNSPAFWSGQQGKFWMTGVDISYGNVNLRPFRNWRVEDIRVIGSGGNGFDLAWWGDMINCRAGGCGAGNGVNGDGANAQLFAEWRHDNCLFHDNFDDGESSHLDCRVEGENSISEYNTDSGFIPALGGWGHYRNCRTGFNGTGFYAADASFAIVDGGISENDGIGYRDISTGRLRARRSLARNSTTFGFDCVEAFDCQYGGTGTARSSKPTLQTNGALT